MQCLDSILEKEIIREEHVGFLIEAEKADAIDLFSTSDDVDSDIIDTVMDDKDDPTSDDVEDTMFNDDDIIDDFMEV